MEKILQDIQEGKKLSASQIQEGYNIVFAGCMKNAPHNKTYEDEYYDAVVTFLKKGKGEEEFKAFLKTLNKVFHYPIRWGMFDPEELVKDAVQFM